MQTDPRDDRIEATIVRYDDEGDTCTLHPVDPEAGRETTEWITATEGSYVSVRAWR